MDSSDSEDDSDSDCCCFICQRHQTATRGYENCRNFKSILRHSRSRSIATSNTVAAIRAYYETTKTRAGSQAYISPTETDEDDEDFLQHGALGSNPGGISATGSPAGIDGSQEDSSSDTNIRFQVADNEKYQIIHGTRSYPPNLDPRFTAGAWNNTNETFTSAYYDGKHAQARGNRLDDYEMELIPENDEIGDIYFMGNSVTDVDNGICTISTLCNIRLEGEEEIDDVYYNAEGQIRQTHDQWHIHVPVCYEDGTTVKTRIFADPGANSACVDDEWAREHFPNMIAVNKDRKILATPGGKIKPKRYINMVFPTKTGTILQSKMYLVRDLPVDILADINMLRAFGYVFRDETPPIFRHDEEKEIDLEIDDQEEMLQNNLVKSDWYNCNMVRKLHQGKFFNDDLVMIDEVHEVYDEIRGNNELLFNATLENPLTDDNGNIQLCSVINNICERDVQVSNVFAVQDESYNRGKVQDLDVHLVAQRENDEILNVDNVDIGMLAQLDDDVDNINNALMIINGTHTHTPKPLHFKTEPVLGHSTSNNNSNTNNDTAPVYHKCLFLMARQSFLATEEEKAEAAKICKNRKLEYPDYSYLKEYPKKYGSQFDGLYEMVQQWLKDNADIFATHTFSRRTMTVKPQGLGIKPEHRDKVMFAPQYPLSPEKRLHYINYTKLNDENKFWKPIEWSLHAIPATMVPKKWRGVFDRYRPAFDARVVNQWCQLIPCCMPTLLNFKELHSKPGLCTMADVKNYFDCMPLAEPDQKYAVAQTPLGLRQMTCWTYGFTNAAAVAQSYSNDIALYVGNTLAYIDDFTIKHLLEGGTFGVKVQLDKLAYKVREKNMYLNPVKFYPCCDYSISFGFQNTMIGQLVSDAYQRKMLAAAKPMSKAAVRSVDGLLNYMNSHIYKHKLFMYWITQLEEKTDLKTRKKRLQWTREANLAWEQLQHLLANLPLLHHPTIDGQFCVQTDTCNYGTGAVLWQYQRLNNEWQWVIVDMFSRVMPKQLRHCHSIIHEAWGVVTAIAHWKFYLVKRQFIVSTDNEPVATIFGEFWKELAPMTQRQLIRLRTKISVFSFKSYHVKGLNNPIADQLSRFTIQLINEDKQRPVAEQEYAPVLKVKLGKDEQRATAKEKISIQRAKEEGERLERYLKRIKAESKILSVQFQSFTPQHNVCTTVTRTPQQQYESWSTADTRMWNEMMRDYKHTANYLEQDRIHDIITSTDNNLIRSDENSYNSMKGDDLQDALLTVMQTFSELTPNTQGHINDAMYNEVLQHQQEQAVLYQSNVSQTIVNNIVMLNNDALYDPTDDLAALSDSDDSQLDQSLGIGSGRDGSRRNTTGRSSNNSKPTKLTRSTRMTTRSQVRKQQQRADDEMSINSDDDIENVQFERMRDNLKTRKEFMQELFGHRDTTDVFNFEKFRETQQSDNVLSLAVKLLQIEAKEWDDDDVTLLREWEPGLLDKLREGKLVREDGILMVFDFDEAMDEEIYKYVVPFQIRGKLMEYFHHNLQQHHFDATQTLQAITRRYWWDTLQRDVNSFCDHCYLCQFSKGGVRHRAPLVIREFAQPLQHIFADFLGPVYGKYYVLVLVDKTTGYSMLIPTNGCDAMTIIDSILRRWVPIFGWFTTFECDWGSGFASKLVAAFTELSGMKQELAEPRNHRSIGKVERVIGFLQTVMNRYNLLLDRRFTEKNIDYFEAWRVIEMILPFIQFGFNQRRPRFTTFSPNMLIFGRNMNDISDISRLRSKLQDIQNNKDLKMKNTDYRYLEKLVNEITRMNAIFKEDWKDYTWLSKEWYDARWKITQKKIERYTHEIRVGKQVLYFIGDKQVAQQKWRERWTGPWRVDKVINDSSLIIADIETGNQKRVSFDRVKLFKSGEFYRYRDIVKWDESYVAYKKQLLKKLSRHNVKIRNKRYELDYTKNDTPVNALSAR